MTGLAETRIIPEAIDPKNIGIENEGDKFMIYYFIDSKSTFLLHSPYILFWFHQNFQFSKKSSIPAERCRIIRVGSGNSSVASDHSIGS